ncbi:MAG: 3-phosphoshikimate 1-carboxyvinyltransferase [Nitrospinota bacterium]|nr:3-phosphoshikimate 1-carboxyvinyltransferase [Nitrospinota bacterium]
MRFKTKKSILRGETYIPGSKSHTIRALFIASLAEGISKIARPLVSADAISALNACRSFGAKITEGADWIVEGTGGKISLTADTIDVGNSGTTARFALGMASLGEGEVIITGDEQTRSRLMGSLIDALNNLGAQISYLGKEGYLPVKVKGKISGGSTSVSGVTSQFLSSLLINTPLADNDSEILVDQLNEKPYVEITLNWLESEGIAYERDGYKRFTIKGGQKYKPFSRQIPADFSSASFFLAACVLEGTDILIKGLDMNDTQGDKEIIKYLTAMGGDISITTEGIRVKGGKLKGIEIDMNDTPDALPIMSVVGCLASGQTILKNVPQARLKETDRINVMCQELKKMGGDIEELPDGLIIKESKLQGTKVEGHGDHRVIMSMSIAGMAAEGETIVEGAESVNITFPTFADIMQSLKAQIVSE